MFCIVGYEIFIIDVFPFFFFKQKTAYEIMPSLVGSEMCIRDSYMVLPKYQFVANGMYQGPWGVNFGANWLLRQGYAMPYFRSNVATGDQLSNLKSVLVVNNVTAFRLPKVSSLDVRLEKAFKISRFNMMADLDVFNITNNATVLGKQFDLRRTGPTGFNQVLEIMNPRILRVGARLN